MKMNLFAISLVSVVLFACGGKVDGSQNGIVGISSVAGATNSIAGTTSLESNTYSAGGTINVSAGGTASIAGSASETATGGTSSTDGSSETTTGGVTTNPTTDGTSSTDGSSMLSTGGVSATGGSQAIDTQPPFPVMPVTYDSYCKNNMPFSYIDTTDHMRMYYMGGTLEFSLNPNSPKGAIGDGLQTVIIVDATAKCMDIELKRIMFQTTTDGDDIGWMTEARNVVSGISYKVDGTPVFASYGPGSALQTSSSVTGLYWDYEFNKSILIKKDQTFTFSLAVTFGETVTPPGTFDFRLYPRYTWYKAGDPSSYPEEFNTTNSVQGNILSYAPSL